MLLFIDPKNFYISKLVVPMARVYEICGGECEIIVNYDSGELVEVDGKFEKKIESVKIVYDSHDEVNKIFRQFYKAVSNGSNAFYFGNTGNSDEKKN